MGLSIGLKKGRSCSIITCDTCGQPIKDRRMAIVAFPKSVVDSVVPVQVFHKGGCDTRKKGVADYWEPLDRYLRRLLSN